MMRLVPQDERELCYCQGCRSVHADGGEGGTPGKVALCRRWFSVEWHLDQFLSDDDFVKELQRCIGGSCRVRVWWTYGTREGGRVHTYRAILHAEPGLTLRQEWDLRNATRCSVPFAIFMTGVFVCGQPTLANLYCGPCGLRTRQMRFWVDDMMNNVPDGMVGWRAQRDTLLTVLEDEVTRVGNGESRVDVARHVDLVMFFAGGW